MKTIILTLVAFLSACVDVRISEPQACVSQVVNVPGVPVAMAGAFGTVSQSQTFGISLGDAPADVLTSVLLTGGDVSATDLSFLDGIRLTLIGIEPLVILDVQGAVGDNLVIPRSPRNLTEYIKGGQIEVQLDVSGRLPEHDFTVNVGACMSADAEEKIDL